MKRRHNQKAIPILLTIGIIISLNVLIQPFNLRFDLTKNKQYTLSPATKQILSNLNENITVTAYFSDGLPPDVSKVKRDFQDLLVELSALAKGKLDYKFVVPNTDAIKQEAANNGIRPLMINVREKDQVKQQQAFLGALIKSGTESEIIPYVQPGASMEYDLVAAIKKLSLQHKPKLAFIQGHGEATFNQLAQVVADIAQLYEIQDFDLSQQILDKDSVKVAVIVGAKTPFSPDELQKLDDFLLSGGSIVVAVNRMEIDMQSAMALPSHTGLEYWLETKGILIDTSLVLDVQCGSVTVPQYMGSMQINTQVQFPYLPLAVTFADHPAVKGMQQVLFPYVSPIQYRATLPQSKFTPLVFSSDKSGIAPAPVTLRVGDKKWTQGDFPLGNQILAGLYEQTQQNGNNSKLIVFGDADFPLSNEQGKVVSDMNTNLLVNAIDWLGDDSGLINLRGKVVAAKPIHAKYLLEESTRHREFIKWGNVTLPVVFLLLFGITNFQRNKRLRLQRTQEQYLEHTSTDTN